MVQKEASLRTWIKNFLFNIQLRLFWRIHNWKWYSARNCYKSSSLLIMINNVFSQVQGDMGCLWFANGGCQRREGTTAHLIFLSAFSLSGSQRGYTYKAAVAQPGAAVTQSDGDWAEKWRSSGSRLAAAKTWKLFWYQGKVPERLKSTAKVPMSKLLNPQMLT